MSLYRMCIFFSFVSLHYLLSKGLLHLNLPSCVKFFFFFLSFTDHNILFDSDGLCEKKKKKQSCEKLPESNIINRQSVFGLVCWV